MLRWRRTGYCFPLTGRHYLLGEPGVQNKCKGWGKKLCTCSGHSEEISDINSMILLLMTFNILPMTCVIRKYLIPNFKLVNHLKTKLNVLFFFSVALPDPKIPFQLVSFFWKTYIVCYLCCVNNLFLCFLYN